MQSRLHNHLRDRIAHQAALTGFITVIPEPATLALFASAVAAALMEDQQPSKPSADPTTNAAKMMVRVVDMDELVKQKLKKCQVV